MKEPMRLMKEKVKTEVTEKMKEEMKAEKKEEMMKILLMNHHTRCSTSQEKNW